MKSKKKYPLDFSDEKWNATAAFLSGEKQGEAEAGEVELIPEEEIPLTSDLWRRAGNQHNKPDAPDTGAAWDKVYSRLVAEGHIHEPSTARVRRITRGIVMRVAASMLLVATLGYITWRIAVPDEIKQIAVASGDSRNTVIDLPDGSRVTLNRNSTLLYPSKFSGDSRQVSLTGEAYFEVVRNSTSPFRVATPNASVEVLGTSFSINTESPTGVEVYVSTGSVRLTSAEGVEGVVLTEGYVGTAYGGKTSSFLNQNPNYLSWQSGVLKYESASLETVFAELKRAYGIEIEAEPSLVSQKLITTTFDNVSEEEIIRIISATFNLSWRKEGRVYLFSQQ